MKSALKKFDLISSTHRNLPPSAFCCLERSLVQVLRPVCVLCINNHLFYSFLV